MNKQDKENAAHAILIKIMTLIGDEIDTLPVSESEKANVCVVLSASLSARSIHVCDDVGEVMNDFMRVFHKHYNNFAERDGIPQLEMRVETKAKNLA
jgi:hypothetical protein